MFPLNCKTIAFIFLLSTLMSSDGGVPYKKLHSHGCGVHPVLQLLSSPPFNGVGNLQEVLDYLDNNDLKEEFLNDVAAWKACVRAPKGRVFKRAVEEDLFDKLNYFLKR